MRQIYLTSTRGTQARIDCTRENLKTVKAWMSNGSTVAIDGRAYDTYNDVEAYILKIKDGRHLYPSPEELELG